MTTVRNRGQGAQPTLQIPQFQSPNTSNEKEHHRRLAWTIRKNVMVPETCMSVGTLFVCLSFWLWAESSSSSSAKTLWNASVLPGSKPRIIMLENPFQNNPLELNQWNKPIHLKKVKDPKENRKKEASYDRNHMVMDNKQSQCSFIAAHWQAQTSAKPNCNNLHEVGIQMGDPGLLHRLEFIDSGAYKDVWTVFMENDTPNDFVLKTSRYSRDYYERDFDRHRRDTLVMDMASSSPYVLDIYAYCGQSGLVERARGTLKHWLAKYRWEVEPIKLLQVAAMVAQGVADMHLFHNGMATVAHADIKTSQFLLTSEMVEDPIIKINDLNRCKHLTTKHPPEICPFYIDTTHKGSTFRSPEEYTHHGAQTDKIDVFSMGSVFYYILTLQSPFEHNSFNTAMQNIVKGVDPPLPDALQHSRDPSIVAIIDAMRKCRQLRAEDRPQSSEIAKLLTHALEKIKYKTTTLEREGGNN